MNGVSGGAAGQHIALDPRTERLFGDLKIIRRLKDHPVLRGSSEITGQPHGRVGGNRPLAVDNGADAVHRNAQITRKLVETDLHIAKVFEQDLSGVNGWKLLPR